MFVYVCLYFPFQGANKEWLHCIVYRIVGASTTVLEMAEITVERAAFARLYLHVLFPNGDGDIARDQ